MKTYTLTVNENQARLLSQALELVARVQTGQWHEFIDWLPQQEKVNHHDLREQLMPIMRQHFANAKPESANWTIDGWASHYGILSEHVEDTARVAWDLQKVIDHCLAWDNNPEGGYTVDFDGPRHVGKQPLATMKRVIEGDWLWE